MRILWHGVPSTLRTGYGIQTKLFTRALMEMGHEVAVSATVDQFGTGIGSDGIVNYATGAKCQMMGNHLIADHVAYFKPDIVISMNDVYACKPEIFDKFRWYPFVMVDSQPLLWWSEEVLKAAQRPIAPTRWSMQVLEAAGFDPLYVPLAVDFGQYRIINKADARQRLKDIWGIDLQDKFVVAMNSANHSNPSRKNFAAAFRAWSMFAATHSDSVFYVHAEISGDSINGEDLRRVEKLYGVENTIIYAPQYEYRTGIIGEDYMRDVYNAADVLLNTSRGEGFGLPLIEAQACGTSVIAPDFGNMAELTVNGFTCRGTRYMYFPGTEQFLVDPEHVARGLSQAYKTHKQWNTDGMRIETRSSVSQYSIQNIMSNYMNAALDEIMENLRTQQNNQEIEHEERTEAQSIIA